MKKSLNKGIKYFKVKVEWMVKVNIYTITDKVMRRQILKNILDNC